METQLQIVISNPILRKKYFEYDFSMFYAYHSTNKVAPFQVKWLWELEKKRNILLMGFRWSAKTTIIRWYVLWCILYKKNNYIIVQSYENTLSGAWVREVAKMLILPRIVMDYGNLYPFDLAKKNMAKSGMSNFEATNWVKIESKSLGETIRWANTLGKDGMMSRPDLLILDDIDVEKSVRNVDIIDNNERKILGETMGALDPTNNRIIFLWNVINEDGIVPRFKKKFQDEWVILEQWLYDDGVCVWADIFSEEVINDLKSRWERSFAQNYLWAPYTWGMSIIKRSNIKYADYAPPNTRNIIGIDPAFSTKTGTDAMGFTLTMHDDIYKYVHTMVGFEWEEKNEERFVSYVWEMYQHHNVDMVYIESNNGGEIIGRMLRAKGMAVEVTHAEKDKVTRLMEYEGCFERWEVYFLPGNDKGIEQLLSFPNGAKDDQVDSMVYSFKNYGGVAFWRA